MSVKKWDTDEMNEAQELLEYVQKLPQEVNRIMDLLAAAVVARDNATVVHMLRQSDPMIRMFCGLSLRVHDSLRVTFFDDHVTCPACKEAVGEEIS